MELFRLCRAGCKSWYCDRCAFRKGRLLQERVARVVETFGDVLMLTLTFDPKLHAGPGAAWWHGKGKIGRLIRDLRRDGHLKSGRYQWFWENHKSGYPHFHVLVEAKFLKHASVKALWSRYGCGSIVHCRRRKRGETKSQAAYYASKYVTKQPEGGWPVWVMQSTARIVRYGGSKGFFKMLEEPEVVSAKVQLELFVEEVGDLLDKFPRMIPDEALEPIERRGPCADRTYEDRGASCGSTTVVQRVDVYERGGGECVERVRYFGRFTGPATELARLLRLDPDWALAEVETASAPDLWLWLDRGSGW